MDGVLAKKINENHCRLEFAEQDAATTGDKSPVVADEISASEALFAFAAWLTTRPTTTHLGMHHDVPPVIERIKEFCKSQGLAEPRPDWDDKIKPYPEDTK